MITCPKCGHEGFWMENMKSGSYFACFSLDCNWRSATPPNKNGPAMALALESWLGVWVICPSAPKYARRGYRGTGWIGRVCEDLGYKLTSSRP